MMQKIETVTEQILKKITPSTKDREKIEALTCEIERKIVLACKHQGVPAIVRTEGSVAKDTWLRENPDIDVFVRLPTSIPRKDLGDVGLGIARQAAGGARQIERFAEHPYLEVFVNGYRIDIVPCYDVKRGEWQSATDRTPFHTDYIKEHLKRNFHGEVRLLKKFMQGVGVYGAEIKIGGFSGYLCELLIMKYLGFAETMRAFARYNQRMVIDIEHYYENREKELSLLFREPLVIVDPVDEGRNVASAVHPQKLYCFVGAARAFLKKPNVCFFYAPKPRTMPIADLDVLLDSRGSSMIFVVLCQFSAVPDVLWGQLYKSKRALRKLIELNDGKILRDAVWSDEKTLSVFVFELEQLFLSNVKRHLGPPLEREAESDDFLAKYADNKNVISGPYIEDGRWMVELPRKTTDMVAFLRNRLADGGRDAGVAKLVAQSMRKNFRILVRSEISEVYKENVDLAVFLTDFVSGKPFWL